MAEIKAVIFDMDGVISDTQKLHAQVESEIFKRFDIELKPEEITKKYAGVKIRQFFQEVLEGKHYDLDELVQEKRSRMIELATFHVDPVPGIHDLVNTLKEKEYALAVASASQMKYVKIVLEKLGLTEYFSELVGGDLVKQGKPNPESFLLAATKLGIQPEHCLVIEDGLSGMMAAKTAGMTCIGLVSDKKEKDVYPTKHLVESLSEITPNYISNL